MLRYRFFGISQAPLQVRLDDQGFECGLATWCDLIQPPKMGFLPAVLRHHSHLIWFNMAYDQQGGCSFCGFVVVSKSYPIIVGFRGKMTRNATNSSSSNKPFPNMKSFSFEIARINGVARLKFYRRGPVVLPLNQSIEATNSNLLQSPCRGGIGRLWQRPSVFIVWFQRLWWKSVLYQKETHKISRKLLMSIFLLIAYPSLLVGSLH